MKQLVLVCCLLIVCSACSKSDTNTPPAGAEPAAPPAAPGGHVVAGTVPAASNGISTIVVLEASPPRQLPASDQAVLDQTNRVFSPDILFARVGDPVEFRNSDDTLHNVNVTDDSSKQQMFNVAIIPETVYRYTFAQPGLYDVHCDIHQTMASLIVATNSPYAKLADPDGRVQFDDVAPGGYVAMAYVGAKKLEQPIEVTGARTEIAIKN